MEPVYEQVPDSVTEYVMEPATETVVLPEPVPTPIPGRIPKPGVLDPARPHILTADGRALPASPRVVPEVVPKEYPSAINYQADPRFQARPVPVTPAVEPTLAPAEHPSAINYQVDTRFQTRPVSETAAAEPTTANASPQLELNPTIVEIESCLPGLEAAEQATGESMELVNEFMETLEREHNFFIASNHEDIVVVHSAEDFITELKKLNPRIDVNLENAADTYLRNLMEVGSPQNQAIVWPDACADMRFFENPEEFCQYLISSKEPDLNLYYDRFVRAYSNSNFFSALRESDYVKTLATNMGISIGTATIIFALYEVIKFGVAIPTHGATLALP